MPIPTLSVMSRNFTRQPLASYTKFGMVFARAEIDPATLSLGFMGNIILPPEPLVKGE
jgi:hypothetical protein